MSWVGDTFAGLKRIIELDSDVMRLRESVERMNSAVVQHETRLVRIETIIEMSRSLQARLPNG